jgi:hypothetical protein
MSSAHEGPVIAARQRIESLHKLPHPSCVDGALDARGFWRWACGRVQVMCPAARSRICAASLRHVPGLHYKLTTGALVSLATAKGLTSMMAPKGLVSRQRCETGTHRAWP